MQENNGALIQVLVSEKSRRLDVVSFTSIKNFKASVYEKGFKYSKGHIYKTYANSEKGQSIFKNDVEYLENLFKQVEWRVYEKSTKTVNEL